MDLWGFVLIPRVRHRLRSIVDYLFGDGYLKVTDLYELIDVPEVGDQRLLIATREGFIFDILNDRVKIVGRSDGITQCSVQLLFTVRSCTLWGDQRRARLGFR